MSKVIHKELLNLDEWQPQPILTGGGRVVKAFPDEHSDKLVELYFECDHEAFMNDDNGGPRLFIHVSTGQRAPDEYEYVATVHVTDTSVHHIYQQKISEAKVKPKDVVSVGNWVTPTYTVLLWLHRSREMLFEGVVSETGVCDLLIHYSELDQTRRTVFMTNAQNSGRGETSGHVVDGESYSMTVVRNGA